MKKIFMLVFIILKIVKIIFLESSRFSSVLLMDELGSCLRKGDHGPS